MEDREIKKLLQKNLEVSQDILKISKKLNRARIVGGFFRILKWGVIVALSVGAYYYIEPYLRTLMDSISSITSGVEQIRQTSDALVPAGDLESASQDIMSKLQGLLGR